MKIELKNGAKVIHYLSNGEDALVLAFLDKNGGEYATWNVDDDMSAYCGNYFSGYRPAVVDFLHRARVKGIIPVVQGGPSND